MSDSELFEKVKRLAEDVVGLKQYYTDTKNPIAIISVNKNRSQKEVFYALRSISLHVRIIVIVDDQNNNLNNPYMLLWRVVNNIDSNRDIYVDGNTIGIDATNKNIFDGFTRRWPDDVTCTKSVLSDLINRKILNIDDEFIEKWGLV